MKTIAHGGNLRASCGREFRGRPAPGDGAPRVPAAHSWFPRSCPRMSPAASTAPPAGVGVPISRAAPQDPALAPAARRSATSGNAFPGRPGAGRARSPGQGPRGPGVGWGRVSARHGFLSGRTVGRQDAGRRRTSVPRCVSVCVCGALTLPVAGTVLVPMAGLGLLLVPALLPAPPPAPSSAGGRGPAVAVPLGRVSRGPQVLPRGAAVRSRPLQLCLRGGDRAWPLQRQAPAEPGSL